MSPIKLVAPVFQAIGKLVLSLTCHTRLSIASEPQDYDIILRRTIREVKFYSETLLAVLLVIRTPQLISSTLACLLFTLITYIVLESMTGDSLHHCIDEFPCGRMILACMTKFPALTVLYTFGAVGLSEWSSPATKIVIAIVSGILVLGLLLHLRIHVVLADLVFRAEKFLGSAYFCCQRSKQSSLEDGDESKGSKDADCASLESKDNVDGSPIGPDCV